MTDVVKYYAYSVINPIQETLTRSLRGTESPYRAVSHSVTIDGVRIDTYDTSNKQYILVYKRIVGQNFIEPSGSYVSKLYDPGYIPNYVHDYYYKRIPRGNSTQKKYDNWNEKHVKHVCDEILKDVIFTDPHDTAYHRADVERVLGDVVELLQEGDIAAAHYEIFRLRNSTSQHVNVSNIYNKFDTEAKKLYNYYPWLDATRIGNEGDGASGDGDFANVPGKDPDDS